MAVYVMISLVIGICAAAGVITSPTTTRAQERASRRRRRYVARYPSEANSADIRAMLMREGVSREQAHFITDLAAEHQIRPTTMWRWIQEFDASSLAVVVAADLAGTELVRHLENHTSPDVAELEVFAAINGLTLDGDASAERPQRHRRVLAGHELAVDLVEPGTWPAGDLHVPESWTAQGPRRDGGIAA